MKVIPETRCVH